MNVAGLSFPSTLSFPPSNNLLDICDCYAFFQIIYLFSCFYLPAPHDLLRHWLPGIANAARNILIKGLSHEQKSKVENEGDFLAPHP